MNIFLLLAQGLLALIVGWTVTRAIRAVIRKALAEGPGLEPSFLTWPEWTVRWRPLLAFTAPMITKLIQKKPQVRRQLAALGGHPGFDDREFSRMQWSFGLLTTGAAALFLLPLIFWADVPVQMAVWITAGTGIFVFLMFRIRLQDRYQQMRGQLSAAFPNFLDVLALTLETGKNFQSSIHLSIRQMPDTRRFSGLKVHLQEIVRGLRAGETRTKVLERFAERVAVPEVTQFVASVLTAERQGASIADILRRQAAGLRTSRALYAERQAMKAPVKLLAPLAICIFPCTFVVLMFPIAARLVESGLFS